MTQLKSYAAHFSKGLRIGSREHHHIFEEDRYFAVLAPEGKADEFFHLCHGPDITTGPFNSSGSDLLKFSDLAQRQDGAIEPAFAQNLLVTTNLVARDLGSIEIDGVVAQFSGGRERRLEWIRFYVSEDRKQRVAVFVKEEGETLTTGEAVAGIEAKF